jgi:hypothetical protein
MVPEKSSMGEISSKISSRPDLSETSSPASSRDWTTPCQASLPTSQSKLVVWRSRSLGTSRGSEILAKEVRCGLRSVRDLVLREAAKRGPSEGSRAHLRPPTTDQLTGQAGSI